MPKAVAQQVKCRHGLLWQPSGYDSGLPVQGARVQSLVRELDATWQKKKKKKYRLFARISRVEYDKRNGL